MKQIIVFKCGGSSVNELSDDFFDNVKELIQAGKKPVIVHGGGPAIKEMLEQFNIEFEFVDGLRKTTEEMMDIVEMVLSGKVNSALTRRVNEAGIMGAGVSGTDLNLIQAKPIDFDKYGLVGEVSAVNVEYIHALLENDIVPIISPVALGSDYKRYNVNADTVASAVAAALQAEQLILVTDVPGILKDGELLEEVTTTEIEALVADGTIYGGMIPKVKAAMNSLSSNVKEVMIVNGKESEMKDTTTLAGTTIIDSANVELSGK